MTRRMSIFITLLALMLITGTAVGHPDFLVDTGTAVANVFDWVTDKVAHLVERPVRCPWSTECI